MSTFGLWVSLVASHAGSPTHLKLFTFFFGCLLQATPHGKCNLNELYERTKPLQVTKVTVLR